MAAKTHVPQPALPGFDHIRRYYDPKTRKITAKILPAEFYVTTEQELVTTLLGSCVAACMWDPVAQIGGMNHFMLPGDEDCSEDNRHRVEFANRYGFYAMEILINTILKNGGERSRLRVKLVGGGNVIQGATTIGHQNVEFARSYLVAEGFELVSEHLEGSNARKVAFDPLTGQAKVMEMPTTLDDSVRRYQKAKAAHMVPTSTVGDIELF